MRQTDHKPKIDASMHPIEGAGAASAGAAAATPLAALLTRHLLRDGELVVLILKPSIWFIPLSAWRFITAVVIGMIAARLFIDRAVNPLLYLEAGAFLIAGRLMWAVLQWTSRVYVLTDMRIARISGVFNVSIFDCPLRKVARTRLISPMRERLLRIGSIEIIPSDDDLPVWAWQTVPRPVQVHELIVATINKARQGGCHH